MRFAELRILHIGDFHSILLCLLFLLSTPLMQACSVSKNSDNQVHVAEVEEEEDGISDPLEGFNRVMFTFNDYVDLVLLGPLSRGYDYVTPDYLQERFRTFYDNFRYPMNGISSLAQGKFGQLGDFSSRFVINSSLGILGIWDVASELGIEKPDREDTGLALAHHGVGHGAYLVLPLLGPSSLRDGVGRVVDSFLDPVSLGYFSGAISSSDAVTAGTAIQAWNILQSRVEIEEAIKTSKENSLDPYIFFRTAYYQSRKGLLNDGKLKVEEDESFGDDEDEDFGE